MVLAAAKLHVFDLELSWRRMVMEVRCNSFELPGVGDAIATTEHAEGSRRGRGWFHKLTVGLG